MILVLFTKSFPYDAAAEHTFIQRELPYLKEVFDRVILIPKTCHGKKLALDSSVELDEDYSTFLKRNSKFTGLIFHAIISHHLYQELLSRPEIILFPFKFLKLLKFSSYAEITRRWIRDWLKNLPAKKDEIVLYTYWFEDITTGLALGKQLYPQIRLTSRAHGYDIYEEQYFPYYWPLRRQTLAKLNKLFLVSQDGRDYFRNHYPQFQDLFETAHLGFEEPGFITRASADRVFRIVSCSHIVPLKRIDLLLEGIESAARLRPEQKFEWHHFGDGWARSRLQKLVKNKFRDNALGYLPGSVPNQDVLRHYRENPVDVFINMSTTEGASVAMMEAISCGIPVIATNVGGNPEIVSERNGILLNPDPTPQDIAEAIFTLLDNPEMAAIKRKGSRAVWMERYNAEVNFRAFAERLKSIGER